MGFPQKKRMSSFELMSDFYNKLNSPKNDEYRSIQNKEHNYNTVRVVTAKSKRFVQFGGKINELSPKFWPVFVSSRGPKYGLRIATCLTVNRLHHYTERAAGNFKNFRQASKNKFPESRKMPQNFR
jgi:hypothetical protein